MTITTADCIERLTVNIKVQNDQAEFNPNYIPDGMLFTIRAKLIALDKMEAKHGPADADEVAHYESCECCGNFHRLEEQFDKHKAAAEEMAKALEDAVQFIGTLHNAKTHENIVFMNTLDSGRKALTNYRKAVGQCV